MFGPWMDGWMEVDLKREMEVIVFLSLSLGNNTLPEIFFLCLSAVRVAWGRKYECKNGIEEEEDPLVVWWSSCCVVGGVIGRMSH